ncbi:iron-containing alcohol dehydrogenase [Allocoprobacillus halotolerans]|uniref:Iron-containing alcohol dehydrogenase n=1 Tax=Allocoprobacillus halotolerans TaxID=2944914 RepID=A0ABY5I8U3_9FIRM|nr:iron-containing alcohol dehydrogenase [Allocoprobacillus halotolerans]UTY40350.1 iron-containing alcohol dehydrogenase [Allocoprobacillus halotolerans]
MYFEFVNKTKVCAGKNALSQLEYECQQYHMKHPLILTDDVLYKLKYVDIITKHLTLEISLFTNIPVDSSIHTIEEIKDYYIKEQCDGIIALGGGSVLDTAKGVYLMLSQDCQSIEDILGFEDIPLGKDIPFFAIPTTSGTGSEATCVAVVSHPEKKVKLEIISQHIQSHVAFLDPVLTQNLPIKTTVSTGIDALTHAIEAYTCSQKNPISDGYAISAIRTISQNILEILEHPKDADIRLNLALASYEAGCSFSNSMVGIVHAIGHALGAVCHIPHGDAMSMLLVPCMRYNLDVNKDLYADLLLYLGQIDLYTQTPKDQLGEKAIDYITSLLQTLHEKAALPISLQSIENLNDNIDEIVEKALNDGALIVNNKYASKQDIRNILEGHYGY